MATPSDAHLLAFGRIIHNFASVETGIELALVGILNTFADAALIAFEPYSAVNLRNVAKSMAKERLKPELSEQFCMIVGDWFAFNGLRNIIAHSRWTEADREGAIKPRRLSILEGRANWIGNKEEEKSYTSAELEEEAERLRLINERLKQFHQTSGLADIILRNIDSANSDTSATSGRPVNSPSK
jgi:hypothetical protein